MGRVRFCGFEVRRIGQGAIVNPSPIEAGSYCQLCDPDLTDCPPVLVNAIGP